MPTSPTTLLVVLLAGASPQPQDTIRLDGLDRAGGDAVVPPGWQLRAVGGEQPPVARVVRYGTGPALSLAADSAAGQVWLELDRPLAPIGRLEWRWRIERQLRDVDLRDPERDDAPARLFVVFGRGGMFSRPRMLFYTWGGAEAIGTAFASHVSDRVRVVVLRNRDDPPRVWHDESRDVAADFRDAFGEDPPEITAVGLMLDTDQVGGSSAVELDVLRWITGATEGSAPGGEPSTERTGW